MWLKPKKVLTHLVLLQLLNEVLCITKLSDQLCLFCCVQLL